MRRASSCALRVALVAHVLLGARAGHAEPLPVTLAWDAPPECPSQAEVLAELSRITRVKPGRVVTPISADAKITRTSTGRYQLRLRTARDDQTGDTDLDAPDCPVLKRGVTLVLALALGDGVDVIDDKTAPAAPTANTPPPAPRAPPATGLPARSSRALAAENLPKAAAFQLTPWLAAASAWGLVGKPSFGGQLGVGFGQTHWQAFVDASVWPTQTATHVAGVDAAFFALLGAAAGCARQPFGAWSLAACAKAELGVIRGRTEGAYEDGSSAAQYYALGPSVVLGAPVFGPIALRFEAGLGITVGPPHFAIRYFRDVYTVARYVPSLSIGFGFDALKH